MPLEFEENVRLRSAHYAHITEAILYACVAALLAIGAAASMVSAAVAMWSGLKEGSIFAEGLLVIDQLLLVLIFIEILHTVRISIRSDSLLMEPFLIVGIIASVRRILGITTQAAHAIQEGQSDEAAEKLFRNTMVELALLGLLVLIFAVSLSLLRRRSLTTEERLAK